MKHYTLIYTIRLEAQDNDYLDAIMEHEGLERIQVLRQMIRDKYRKIKMIKTSS
jgi:hypothetical protein